MIFTNKMHSIDVPLQVPWLFNTVLNKLSDLYGSFVEVKQELNDLLDLGRDDSGETIGMKFPTIGAHGQCDCVYHDGKNHEIILEFHYQYLIILRSKLFQSVESRSLYFVDIFKIFFCETANCNCNGRFYNYRNVERRNLTLLLH